MVRPDYDGSISPQYYRAAQLNRDFWFTCPVLDFAWQYRKQSSSAEARLFELNATRVSAAYEAMGVPMWRVAHLSDISYVLNAQQLAGTGTDNSAAQLAQARAVSRNIARFVTSGVPHDEKWSTAFANATGEELQQEFPSRLASQLFGGPNGNEHVAIRENDEFPGSDAQNSVRWEKLFQSCQFINSEAVRREAGV